MNVTDRAMRWMLARCVGRESLERLIRRAANLAQIDLLRVAYQSIGVLNYETHVASGEQFLIARILPRLMGGDKPVILDVGANIGEVSLALCRAFPAARVWAFEPNPVTFGVLEQRLEGTGVACRRMALGAAAGEATLHCYAGDRTSGHASMYAGVFGLYGNYGVRGADQLTTFAIAVTTIDAFCREHEIVHIDFLKIDVEGHELAVLRGASGTLADRRIGAIQFEFNECNVLSRVFLRDFYALLPGYRLFRLNTSGLVPLTGYRARNEIFQYQNLLAVRAEFADRVDEFATDRGEGA